MALVNVMENIVEEKLHRMLEAEDCCKCDRCFEDMKAKALNQLPARYVSTHNGELFSKLAATVRQSTIDINVAVANAIDVIGAHPSHENQGKKDSNADS